MTAKKMGSAIPELQLTAVGGGLGALAVLVDMLQGGGISVRMQVTILICLTLVGISYNVSRGLAKYVEVPAGGEPSAPSPSEFKVTVAGIGAAMTPLMLEMLQKKDFANETVTVTLIACATALLVSYNVGQGLAKYERRGGSTPPGASPPAGT